MSRKKVEDEGAPPAAGEPAAVDSLGEQLRGLFRAVETAPVPDEIQRLVADLEAKRGKRSPKRN
jgi:hypothetical protein